MLAYVGMRRAKDWTGVQSGSLTFIRLTDRHYGASPDKYNRKKIWELQCVCGNIVYSISSAVLSGKVQRCNTCNLQRRKDGYVGKRKYDPRTSSARRIYKRAYSDIDFDSFMRLSQLPCYYCGRLPFATYNLGSEKKAISNLQRNNGIFTYNGLDRVDNSKGHTVDNVVPCCYPCNQMKMNRTKEEFFLLVKKVYEKHQLQLLSAI